MIEFAMRFTGICEGCAHQELTMEETHLYADGQIAFTEFQLTCKNKELCKDLAKRIREGAKDA